MHINISPRDIDNIQINAAGDPPFLMINLKDGNWLTLEKFEALKLRAALDEFIAYEPVPAVAEAVTDESVLCDEPSGDDSDTVLYADGDKAILEQTMGGAA